MKRLLCPEIPSKGKSVSLNESESQHATRVLRLRDGDLVQAIDGNGGSTLARLRMRGGDILLEAEVSAGPDSQRSRAQAEEILPITLEIAILKGDAMEWVIEKAVELGIQRIVPLLTDHCVVQIKNKGPDAFRERWQKIADQALKQCGRLVRLEIRPPVELKERVTHAMEPEARRLWCDEAFAEENRSFIMDELLQARPLGSVSLLIGPEGGWSASERTLLGSAAVTGTRRVGLGPRTLRAETAALFGMSLLSGIFQSEST